MKFEQILKDSNYSLSLFTPEEIEDLENRITVREVRGKDAYFVRCLVRERDVQVKPEEIVRQLYLYRLMNGYGYERKRIAVEFSVKFSSATKKADIVIRDKKHAESAYIIVELKKPKWKEGKDQLKSYCHATGAPIGVWTNGTQISYYHRKDPNYFEDLTDIPKATETLADIIRERFTIDDLTDKDKLRTEGKTLRQVIEDMEDEVLANAGVDVFEECFKLIFTKLYDEFESVRDHKRLLEFRNTGQTEGELHDKISVLFDKAKDKWKGVFDQSERIKLKRSHLPICVASLQNIKFFNSNLDIVDDAFEYLVNKSAKGEKGQYFTPRYVIDMCVKMLDPKEDEFVIDPAAGSSGFTVHSIFHVWGKIFEELGMSRSEVYTAEKKPSRCEDYVREKVFAIDFDEKSVRVAKTLNLIAGDGQTNVLYLNSLDYERWNDEVNDKTWRKIYIQGFDRLQELGVNDKENRQFKFDVLLANPPFAGDIKETRVINKYDIAQKANGKYEEKVGRDILFIERNLDFLKAGGRMAVVLPQGRFNNSSDKRIREYIAERCRILAVVGLHGNTFKPHTGTKTSVLFVQKWNDDESKGALCPRVDDYNIFFATQQMPGKDNSGEKLYRSKDAQLVRDVHGHFIVAHDLFNHEGFTEDGIFEAFREFAKKEKFSFASDFFV
ncbi:MAG: type restriction enzyme protein [Acidobacteriota bacterium]|jgi:type I restriction enzyme M protein|nr:type restriction enzyme protein [Acidobacteriota bacterium]